MHATKIWATERTRKVNFIELKAVNGRIYNITPIILQALGIGL